MIRQVRGRVVALSVRAAMIAGAWIAFPLGFVAGCVLGAGIAWFAGAVLAWQVQLSLTLGVTEQLLPFGSQQPLLESVRSSWYVIIPAAGLGVGIFAGLLGALIGGLVAASYNRSPFGVRVTVEVPEEA
ncbi:MAG: hypothetical protein M3077_10270 [Candidatus Dormibacteraeota bacterium]|nr:hypothetical protein [Candidatus Dormibacteraeota bacterium]